MGLARGVGGVEVHPWGDVGVFADEAYDDVGALTEVEIVAAGGEGLGPNDDGWAFGHGERGWQDDIPLVGGSVHVLNDA